MPPRRRGVLAVLEVARDEKISAEEILLLQADADTRYSEGYVHAMRAAAGQRTAASFLVEGLAHPPPTFDLQHPGFRRLSEKIDACMDGWMVPDPYQVIVDDKVSGYLLSDYISWGGHIREFDSQGQEVHAETTRLFIKGKLMGAERIVAPTAIAYPSRRKLLENPVRHFATAGFPREDRWMEDWLRSYSGPNSLAIFDTPDSESALDTAIAMRRAHLFILFNILPLKIAELMGNSIEPFNTRAEGREILLKLRDISKEEVLGNTAYLFERIFSMIENLQRVH